MKKSKYADCQIPAILNQSEAGTPVPEQCREHGMYSLAAISKNLRKGAQFLTFHCLLDSASTR